MCGMRRRAHHFTSHHVTSHHVVMGRSSLPPAITTTTFWQLHAAVHVCIVHFDLHDEHQAQGCGRLLAFHASYYHLITDCLSPNWHGLQDLNVWLPNLFGAVIGVLQLTLRAVYGARPTAPVTGALRSNLGDPELHR